MTKRSSTNSARLPVDLVVESLVDGDYDAAVQWARRGRLIGTAEAEALALVALGQYACRRAHSPVAYARHLLTRPGFDWRSAAAQVDEDRARDALAAARSAGGRASGCPAWAGIDP